MIRLRVDDVAFYKGRLVVLHTGGIKGTGWGVAYLADYVRDCAMLFGVKVSKLHRALWTFTGYVEEPHDKK